MALLLSARREARYRYLFTLIPLGAAMWMGHFGFHLLTAGWSIVPAGARFLGWTASGGMGQVPSWWPGTKVLLLDAGLLATLYLQWRTRSSRKALAAWAIFAVCLYAAGLWILAQPMQMRGMVMN